MSDRPERVDLDDTRNCPLDEACTTCGSGEPLVVVTAESVVGVFCVSLCRACSADGLSPNLGVVRAVERVLAHCTHLDIDVDQMAAAMEAG
jgi:hypothetical protein